MPQITLEEGIEEVVMKMGFIKQKLERSKDSWKKAWFVLSNVKLRIYKFKNESDFGKGLVGSIPLLGASVAEVLSDPFLLLLLLFVLLLCGWYCYCCC